MIPDTIAAIATPPGQGGIAIVRISGPRAEAVLHALFRPRRAWESHQLVYGRVRESGETLDEVMAVLMRAPKSFTREDVAELQCHGGDTASRRVLAAVLRQAGVRVAQPGEFTRRAFENGRIDLTQAEATQQLIAADGDRAARVALRQMDGALSRFVRAAQERLIALLAAMEAAVDFPDEVEEAPAAAHLRAEALSLAETLQNACNARAGRMLSHGLEVVIAGKPNVGKSSLLNLLLGEERAIVTPIPGTTRDMLTGSLLIDGLRVNLTDTAGLHDTADPVETLGIARARAAILHADFLLVLLDASRPLSDADRALLADTASLPRALVLNKTDLPAQLSSAQLPAGIPVLTLSAQTGEGADALRALLRAQADAVRPETALLVQERHVEAAERAVASLSQAVAALDDGLPLDVTAIDLRAALHALGEITGDTVDERVVDRIFADFCVGK